MEAYTGSEHAGVRLLGLGNEILADDAFGIRVAKEVERRFPGQLEVVCSSASSSYLMADVLGTSRSKEERSTTPACTAAWTGFCRTRRSWSGISNNAMASCSMPSSTCCCTT